jgi:hypothetical protein
MKDTVRSICFVFLLSLAYILGLCTQGKWATAAHWVMNNTEVNCK